MILSFKVPLEGLFLQIPDGLVEFTLPDGTKTTGRWVEAEVVDGKTLVGTIEIPEDFAGLLRPPL